MIRTLAVNKDGSMYFDVSLGELRDENIDWFWVDFSQPTEAEQTHLESFFQFHPTSIEDCVNYLQRPKMDYYNGYRFYVLQSLRDDMELEELNMFLSDNYAVTYCQQDSKEIQLVWERIKELSNMSDVKPEQILYLVSDEIVDKLFPIVQDIEDKIQDIDDQGSKSDQDMIDGIREQLSRLSRLRKTVKPMKDLLYRVLNSSHVKISEETKMKLHSLYDHLMKLLDDISDNREVANDIRESYISTNSHKMNQTMKTLTAVSIIFLPLTFLVGVYGMNFDNIPELHTKYGYYTLWTVMLGCAVGIFYWFKRKGWF